MNKLLLTSYYILIFILSCDSSNKEDDNIDGNKSQTDILIEDISEKLIDSPKNGFLYYQRGKLYWSINENERALNDFYKMTSYDSTNSDYFETLADFFVANGNVERGIKALNFAIEYNPEESRYYVKQGKYSLILKKYQNALNYLNNALKRNEQDAEAYLYKGYVYYELKKYTKAISNLQTSIEMDPSWDAPYEMMGEIYAIQNNDLALKYFDNAFSVNPENSSAIIQKCEYIKNSKGIEEAIEDYKKYIQVRPHNPTALYNLSVLNYKIDNIKEAKNHIDICVQIDPANALAYYMKGKIYYSLNLEKEAKESFETSYILDTTLTEAKEEAEKL